MTPHQHEIGDIKNLPTALNSFSTQVHHHAINEVDGLQAELENKAEKMHSHADLAPIDHKHTGYASKNHKHTGYAATDHTHPEIENLPTTLNDFANKGHHHAINEVDGLQAKLENKAEKTHSHADFAPINHTHPELLAAIEKHCKQAVSTAFVFKECEQVDIDQLPQGEFLQAIFTNSGKITHIRDYFVSKQPKRLNCQNILIASGKSFAVRIIRMSSAAVILFDGMLQD